MPAINPSKVVWAGQARRIAAAEREAVRWEWFLSEVIGKLQFTLEKRVRIATEFLRDRIVRNISVPVVRASSIRTRRVFVIERSKPGEFPRAETTQLMKTIFSDVRFEDGGWTGYVGTPLDYGVILELRMNRSFLVRTLREKTPDLTRILTGPIG